MFDHVIWPEKYYRETSAIYALNASNGLLKLFARWRCESVASSGPLSEAHGVTSYQIRERQGAAEVSKQ